MPRLEMLDPRTHGSLRLRPGAQTPHFVQVVAAEFGTAAASCPVLFSKDAASGRFYAGAMFALKSGETALKGADERGGFEPLVMQREGFFISGSGIAIDLDSPRFSGTDGEALFDEAGLPGTTLRQIQRLLGQLRTGLEFTEGYIKALADLHLIEPVDISLAFDTGERLKLQGLYTVSLDSLRELDDPSVIRLFRAGYLQLAYTMIASVSQVAVLAQLRNRRLSRPR